MLVTYSIISSSYFINNFLNFGRDSDMLLINSGIHCCDSSNTDFHRISQLFFRSVITTAILFNMKINFSAAVFVCIYRSWNLYCSLFFILFHVFRKSLYIHLSVRTPLFFTEQMIVYEVNNICGLYSQRLQHAITQHSLNIYLVK